MIGVNSAVVGASDLAANSAISAPSVVIQSEQIALAPTQAASVAQLDMTAVAFAGATLVCVLGAYLVMSVSQQEPAAAAAAARQDHTMTAQPASVWGYSPQYFSAGAKTDSEADFIQLANERPSRLLAIVREAAIRPSRLTFAAEAVGLLLDSDSVRRTLLPLLSHASPVVREGAIYGLSNHLNAETLSVLQRLAEADPSIGVRQAATELVDA